MKYDHSSGQILVSAEELCRFVLHRGETPSLWDEKRRTDREAVPAVLSFLKKDVTRDLLLCGSMPCGALSYALSGTVDLFFTENGAPVLGFVRAVAARDFNKKNSEEYTAYIKCCAFLFCLREKLQSVRVCVFFKNAEGEEIRREDYGLDASTLALYVGGLLSRLAYRAKLLLEHETEIRPSAAEVVFPYGDVRDGQDELIHRGYSVIKQSKRLFAQAPTGIGKTISTLYPAVRAFGRGLCDKIFYLTAKASTRREAFAAVKKMFEAGASLKAIILLSSSCKTFFSTISCGIYNLPIS